MNWTEGRLRAFIISTIRSGMRRYPPKYQAINNAKTEKKVNAKSGRVAMHYRCNGCNKEYVKAEVQVDHIIPVVDPQKGFQGWDTYIERMFCAPENLQVLCSVCHKEKTKKEKKLRVPVINENPST